MKHTQIKKVVLLLTLYACTANLVADFGDFLGPTVGGAALGGIFGGGKGAAIGAGVGAGVGLMSSAAKDRERITQRSYYYNSNTSYNQLKRRLRKINRKLKAHRSGKRILSNEEVRDLKEEREEIREELDRYY